MIRIGSGGSRRGNGTIWIDEIFEDKPKETGMIGIKDCHGIQIKVGDIVKGVNGLDGGPSEVFIGDAGELQPFHFLNDHDGNHFEIVQGRKK
jgi:hypothetical protein